MQLWDFVRQSANCKRSLLRIQPLGNTPKDLIQTHTDFVGASWNRRTDGKTLRGKLHKAADILQQPDCLEVFVMVVRVLPDGVYKVPCSLCNMVITFWFTQIIPTKLCETSILKVRCVRNHSLA